MKTTKSCILQKVKGQQRAAVAFRKMGERMSLVEETGYDKAWRQGCWPLGEKGREMGAQRGIEVTEEAQKTGPRRPYRVWLYPRIRGHHRKFESEKGCNLHFHSSSNMGRIQEHCFILKADENF